MTTDEKLAAILAAVQTDPGNRGLARDPHDNLFTATAGDFAAACWSIANDKNPRPAITTGFYIPTAEPQAFETDGPLGTIFLIRAFHQLKISAGACTELSLNEALGRAFPVAGLPRPHPTVWFVTDTDVMTVISPKDRKPKHLSLRYTHMIAVERCGPARDDRCYTMKGRDITEHHQPMGSWFDANPDHLSLPTIGIGDGGNEIGMGKIPHETIVKNIPNGDLIHCRVPTDHLIVAGVSNWGAYALAAGVYVLRGVKPARDLFDPDREREILEVMVREGPLVDGVTGKQTATVDGLTWDEYAKPLVRIREILES